jgi:quinone-modifying oxidoreductase subunit QmoA
MTFSNKNPIVVIGGGIAGITVALEAAETGARVVVIEREAFIGGRVLRMHKYFPKLCSPLCGMEINIRRLKANPDIRIITLAETDSISGEKGNFEVKISKKPRFVNEFCTCCDKCVAVCPEERNDLFNLSLKKTKAIYLPHSHAFPMKYIIESDSCKGKECGECVKVCQYDAINLDDKEEVETIMASSVVYATGWKPYDATKIDNLGFGKIKNVINNVIMERIAASDGPTEGKLVRPSDGKEVKNVVFVQCAGSRDENHLSYCSSICCLVSLKQATFVREAYPDSKVTIYYIDIRTPGKYEAFYQKVAADENVTLVKGKVAKVEEDSETGDVIVTAEDIMSGGKKEQRADMVVLAAGMHPTAGEEKMNGVLKLDDCGFVDQELLADGIFTAGVAKMPVDVNTTVQDATSVALSALQCLIK